MKCDILSFILSIHFYVWYNLLQQVDLWTRTKFFLQVFFNFLYSRICFHSQGPRTSFSFYFFVSIHTSGGVCVIWTSHLTSSSAHTWFLLYFWKHHSSFFSWYGAWLRKIVRLLLVIFFFFISLFSPIKCTIVLFVFSFFSI